LPGSRWFVLIYDIPFSLQLFMQL